MNVRCHHTEFFVRFRTFIFRTYTSKKFDSHQMTSSSTAALKVAFLGLGSMGNAIAKNILKHQFPLIVWSRTASKADVGNCAKRFSSASNNVKSLSHI